MTHTRPPIRRILALALTATLLVPLFLAAPAVRAQIPEPPVLLTPTDGATTTAQSYSYPPTGTPTLVWQACPGAERYTVQICTTPTCSTYTVRQETYNTRFAYTKALEDGVWYWQVRCYVGGEWSNYSASYQFTKSWLDDGALVTTLLQPTDTTVEFFEGEIFSWTPVIGAAYYRFQIYSQADCQGTAAYSKSTITARHTPASRRDRGDYWWRVTPADNQGHLGTPSECRHFFMDYTQRPTLLTPADESIHILTPDFHWTAVKGAKRYRIQVSTVPDFSGGFVVDSYTRATRLTPDDALENDKDYYWRVAAIDTEGNLGPWVPSEADPDPERLFRMEWHLRPPELTPTYNFLSAPFPVFHWTPVAGTRYYWFQMDDNSDFSSPMITKNELSEPRYVHTGALSFSTNTNYYWRVKALTSSTSQSWWSDTGLFQFDNPPAPTLVYPPYYYDPETISSTQLLDIRTDLTVPTPVFMWDRGVATTPAAADSYRIEIDTSPLFPAPLWSTTTENLSIAPSVENGFALPAGNYYWHVRGYYGGSPLGAYSEPWLFRFDPQQQILSPTIWPYFPSEANDVVYDTPLFGWAAVASAAQYHFQISTSATDFTAPVHEGHPLYGFYTPQERLDPDTYYWRVRAQDSGGNYIGDWTAVRRFVITYPLRRGSPTCTPGPCPTLAHPIHSEGSAARVGADPAGDAEGGADYDLTNLYLARDDAAGNNFWFITLELPPTNTTPMYFVVYVDLDHTANSGGATDPKGFGVQTDPIFRPERAFFIYHDAADQVPLVELYRSSGSGWLPVECLGTASYPNCPAPIGGGWDYDPHARYVELKIPINVLDLGESWLGTVSLEAFSIPYAGGAAYDTVPSEPAGMVANLTNMAAAADKVNLVYPWHNPVLEPAQNFNILHTNPLLSFSKPLYRWWTAGYRIQVARDIGFTNLIITGAEWEVGTPYPQYWFLPTQWGQADTFEENNSLYWRIRIKHCSDGCYGPWSQPMRFTKVNYVPETMAVEYPYAVPTLRWDRIEGAYRYYIQIDDDSNFTSPDPTETTENPSWTPTSWLADGVWYWRIRVQDANARWSNYVNAGSFTKSSPATILTSPVGGVVVNEVPTLNWRYVLTPTVDPVMASSAYRVVLGTDPEGDPPYVWDATVDTTTFTPDTTDAALPDGSYYWKVATVPNADSPSSLGTWSAVGYFYKSYPTVTPVSSSFDPSPNLVWEPQDGAAYYQLQICRTQSWTNCVPDKAVETDQTAYIATQDFGPGLYYWRVRMCDYKNVCGPYYEDRIGPRGLAYLPLVTKGDKD